MTTSRVLRAAAVTLTLLLPAGPSWAHHSFSAEFDGKNCRDFTGTLTKVEWENPHAFFFMDVKDASGKVENWSFQTNAIIVLKRLGMERQLFLENVGKEVFVRGCLARNGKQNYAAAGMLKFSDGVRRQVGQQVE